MPLTIPPSDDSQSPTKSTDFDLIHFPLFPLESTLNTPVVSPSFETQSPQPCLTFEFQAKEKETIHSNPTECNVALTQEELKAHKKAIRQEKNRQSAKKSRVQRMEYIISLQNQVTELKSQNAFLVQIVELLENENKALKREIEEPSRSEIRSLGLR